LKRAKPPFCGKILSSRDYINISIFLFFPKRKRYSFWSENRIRFSLFENIFVTFCISLEAQTFFFFSESIVPVSVRVLFQYCSSTVPVFFLRVHFGLINAVEKSDVVFDVVVVD